MYKLINNQLCNELNHLAKTSARKRSHHNFHTDLTDPVQRLCIALEKGTYIRPHRHPENYKWEMTLVISGSVCLLIFDDQGKLKESIELSEQGPNKGIEIPPNTWHTLVPNGEQAVILEIKQGPYLPLEANNFANWAPEENSTNVEHFLRWCSNAKIGEQYQN